MSNKDIFFKRENRKVVAVKLTKSDRLKVKKKIDKILKEKKEIIPKKYLKKNLKNLSKTAAFFSEADEIINDNYKLKDKELISIIPPIGGG